MGGPINLLLQNPIAFFFLIIPLLYSVIIHEVSHGIVAEMMGDKTARFMGRISLNPISHLDPLGTFSLLFFGFGWAKPVPVNFYNMKDLRKGLILVSSAGIISNLIIAFLAIFIFRSGIYLPGVESLPILPTVLLITARINILLASFNLLPIPPLDGSKILMGFSSAKIRYNLEALEPYGFFIVIGLLMLGVLDPIIHFIELLIFSFFDLFFLGTFS